MNKILFYMSLLVTLSVTQPANAIFVCNTPEEGSKIVSERGWSVYEEDKTYQIFDTGKKYVVLWYHSRDLRTACPMKDCSRWPVSTEELICFVKQENFDYGTDLDDMLGKRTPGIGFNPEGEK